MYHIILENQSVYSAIEKAMKCIKDGNNLKAIEILTPFLNEKIKNTHLQVLEVLASAHTRIDAHEHTAIAFSYWKHLYSFAISKLDKVNLLNSANGDNARIAVKFLSYIIQCAEDIVFVDLSLTRGLELIKAYPAAFDAPKKLNEMLYELYFNTALKHKHASEKTKNYTDKKKHHQKMDEYLRMALHYMPNDLRCLLYLTKYIVVSTQCINSAIEFLTPYDNLFTKNPDYHYALYILYKNNGNLVLSDKHNRLCKHFVKQGYQKKYEYIFSAFNVEANSTEALSMANASYKYRENKFDEARKILQAMLKSDPNYLDAMELSALVECSSHHLSVSIDFCEKALAINPKSYVGLSIKATCLWKMGSDTEKCNAVALSELAYQYGCRRIEILDILIYYYSENEEKQKLLLYAQEKAKAYPSAPIYAIIAWSNLYLDQHDEAVAAFKKVRSLDKYFEHDQISLAIVYTLFQVAITKSQYKACAKKLASYFSCLESGTPDSSAIDLLEAFKDLGIDVFVGQDFTDEFDSKSKEPTHDDDDPSWVVPREIKEKIIAAMQKDLFWADTSMQRLTCSMNNVRVNPQDYVSIGESGKLKGYIDPKVKIPPEIRLKFQKALETHRLLPPRSKNLSGVKLTKDANIYKLKLMRSGMRLFSKSIETYQDEESKQTVSVINFGRFHRKHQ